MEKEDCEWRFGKYVEERGCGLFRVMSQHSSVLTKWNHEKPRAASWSLSRKSKPRPAAYEAGVITPPPPKPLHSVPHYVMSFICLRVLCTYTYTCVCVNKFHGRIFQSFNITNTKAHQWTWSLTSSIHLTPSQRTSLRSILMLSSNPLNGLPSGPFPRSFLTVVNVLSLCI